MPSLICGATAWHIRKRYAQLSTGRLIFLIHTLPLPLSLLLCLAHIHTHILFDLHWWSTENPTIVHIIYTALTEAHFSIIDPQIFIVPWLWKMMQRDDRDQALMKEDEHPSLWCLNGVLSHKQMTHFSPGEKWYTLAKVLPCGHGVTRSLNWTETQTLLPILSSLCRYSSILLLFAGCSPHPSLCSYFF